MGDASEIVVFIYVHWFIGIVDVWSRLLVMVFGECLWSSLGVLLSVHIGCP